MKLFLLALLFILSTDAFGVGQSINDLTTKNLTVNGAVNVNSTTQSSKPCPPMTQTQRDAIATPASGSCVYNTTALALNVWNGSTWGSVGGGLANWVTAHSYIIGDVVIQSGFIYQCAIAHTSGTFATDLAAGDWSLLSGGVDLTSNQTIGGVKTFNGTILGSGDIVALADLMNINPTVVANYTASKTGTTVTATVGTFLPTDVDRIIVWSIGTTLVYDRISAYISATQVTVDHAGTIASQAASTYGPAAFYSDYSANIVSFGVPFKSLVATGTAPFSVASTTLVPNLYAARAAVADDATAKTGTGTTFVMSTSPTLTTPNIGAASGTSLNTSGAITGSNLSGTNTGDLLTKGESEVSDTTTNKIITPNKQMTPTAAGVQRLESGNTNLLANPSFEHSTPATSWTLTNATSAVDTTYKTDGAQALTVTPTVAGGGIKQTSTINAANLVGAQGIAAISVKTAGTDVYVCPLMNGARPGDISQYCANVKPTSTSVVFPRAVVPFILDGTSNGIEVFSQGTSVFTVDNSLVGESNLAIQNVSGARLLGTVTISGCAAQWSTSSTTFTDFTAQTGCTYTTTGYAQAPATMLPAIKFASIPAGDIKIEYEGTLGSSSVAKDAQFQFWDGTNTAREISDYSANSSTTYGATVSQSLSYATSQSNITLSLRSRVTSGGSSGVWSTTVNPGVIRVWYFPPETKMFTKTTAGVASAYAYGTPAAYAANAPVIFPTVAYDTRANAYNASTGRYTVPEDGYYQGTVFLNSNNYPFTVYMSKNGGGTVGADAVNIAYTIAATGAGQVSGSGILKCLKGDILDIRQSTTSGTPGAGSVSFTKVAGDELINGSFAGIEKCANDYECTDTFTAWVDQAGVVYNQNVPWISGNAAVTNTSTYTITPLATLKDGVNNLSSIMNCIITEKDATSGTIIFSGMAYQGTAGGAITTNIYLGGARGAEPFYISCSKGTNDYKPKTAKVATSIGVPTVPGIVGNSTGDRVDTFDFCFGGSGCNNPCTSGNCYLLQNGTGITSVQFASTATYNINFNKTYSKMFCTASAFIGTVGAGVTDPMACTNCASVQAITRLSYTGAGANGEASVHCTGTY